MLISMLRTLMFLLFFGQKKMVVHNKNKGKITITRYSMSDMSIDIEDPDNPESETKDYKTNVFDSDVWWAVYTLLKIGYDQQTKISFENE